MFYNWVGTLLATFISVFAAVGVGLLLFHYQTEVTDDRKRRDLARLTATELESIVDTLQQDVASGGYRANLLYCPMLEQAARSGLLDPQTTANMIRFTSNVQVHNQMVTQFNTVKWSMTSNPSYTDILGALVARGQQDKNAMLSAAQIVLSELRTKYPEASPQD